MNDTDRLAALRAAVEAMPGQSWTASAGNDPRTDPAWVSRAEVLRLIAGITLAPQPDTASRELREALRRAYDGGLIDAPYDDEHRWCDEDSGGNHRLDTDAWLDDLAAALAATEGE